MEHLVGFMLGYARPRSPRGPGSFYIPLDSSIVAVIVVVCVALPLVFIVLFMGKMRRRVREEQRLLATGTPGQARVLSMQHGGAVLKMGAQRHISLVLSLEVHVQGRAPYTIQIQKYISELNLALFQQGAWINVRVDPMNPNSLAIAGAGSAPTAGMPAGAPMAG